MTPAPHAAASDVASDAGLRPVGRALLSVSDKAGLGDLARALAGRGVEIVSTGATAGALRAAGLAVTEVSAVTGVPEMLGGRVKTLHPLIHGGLLARRGDPGHVAEMAVHGIRPIDLLVVNLYPFEAALARQAPPAEMVEEIDVGGPALIRAAAKNHADVAVLTDPADYDGLLAELDAQDGATGRPYRRAQAAQAFARTAAYDAGIAAWMAGTEAEGEVGPPRRRVLAGRLARPLRYGENPHQAAAFYATGEAGPSVATALQIQGKDLSFNNIADADAALALAAELAPQGPACVIVKHGGPCGAALGATLAEAHAKALAADPLSAFGGVVALSRPLDGPTAEAIAQVFTEVVVAPGADEGARAALAGRPNLRLLLTEGLPDPGAPGLHWRQVGGGFLAQDRDRAALDPAALRVATRRAPTPAELADLRLAWAVVKHARSNAIVIAGRGATLGIGAGQTSRVGSVRIAVGQMGARGAGGAVLASDAFFPFADGVEEAARAGVTAIIQPGGSLRDAEVTAAADAAGMAMVLTATRHFRH